MSQFEYVSVAVALVYSLAIARLLGGLPHTSAKKRGAPVALIFNFGLILGGLTSWWVLWRFIDISWTALGFVWIVAMPGLTYLRAAVLLTDNPSQVVSWENHYFEVRTRFFAVGMVEAFYSALLPWVVGAYPWFTPAPVHLGAIFAFLMSLAGLLSTSRRVHLALAWTLLVLVVLVLFLTPRAIGAAG
jgi:hypothetical protein